MSLELRNVVKRVGSETHIHETTLALKDSGFNILLGTTLAGKTTLMQLMAGLEKPSEGEVWFRGRNVTNAPVQKRNVSMVYQQFINYPTLTVFENIASPLRVTRSDDKKVKERVHRIAEVLKLTALLDRQPSQLSGGQQQRTALARALAKDSDLVLLDEPLANLDYKLREELREELPRLFADRDCTVVYATAEPSEALLLGGQTATMHEGRVTEFGETSTLYRKPERLRTARVFSEPPINTANVTKHENTFALTERVRWPVPEAHRELPDGTYTVAVRPHHITPEPQAEATVAIDGRVLLAELSGSESILHFEVDEGIWISQSHGVHPFNVGDTVELHMNIDRCLYFDLSGRLIE